MKIGETGLEDGKGDLGKKGLDFLGLDVDEVCK